MKPREETRSASNGEPPSRRPLHDQPRYRPQGLLRPRQEGQGQPPASPSESPAPTPAPPASPSAEGAATSPAGSTGTSPAESAWGGVPSSSSGDPGPSQNASSSYDPAWSSLNGSAPWNASMTMDPSATSSSSSSSTSTSISRTWSSFTKSRPWTTSSKTSTGSDSKPTFVPGQLFNMTMGGRDRDTVYSVPMSFGHESQSSSYSRKRQDWNGTAPQVLNMMVDLGSSDMVRRYCIVRAWADIAVGRCRHLQELVLQGSPSAVQPQRLARRRYRHQTRLPRRICQWRNLLGAGDPGQLFCRLPVVRRGGASRRRGHGQWGFLRIARLSL